MGKYIDLTGQKINSWEIIKRGPNYKDGSAQWLCQCECGNPEIKLIRGSCLRNGQSKSCGHCQQFKLIGQKIGHLTVRKVDHQYKNTHHIKNNNTYYEVECDCENHTIFSICGADLVSGHTQSCGCLWRQKVVKDITNQTFGYLKAIYPLKEKKYGTRTVWHCICLRDGNECDVLLDSLVQGKTQSCGCIKSLGEAHIQSILQNNNIKFEKQKTFENLISEKGRQYHYDFYLPAHNRLIEFDGIQHYEYRKTTKKNWNTKEHLEKTQRFDKIKNEYALSHNIELVRIPYWERDNITLDMLLGDKYLVKDIENENEEIIF